MENRNGTLDSLVSDDERLAVIGSPSSTSELALDILGTAVTRKLVGELALFQFLQDSVDHYAIGQITEVQLRNTWHEDPTMRSLIRQRGRVDAVSERQDTHSGQMLVSAVFQRDNQASYRPSILGTVPATGTPIHKVDDKVLEEILSPYSDQIFYLGNVYGSEPKLPLWFKHFDSGPDGAGEAYHLGVFGKTGSGKSVLAKMILLAYARHPKMALLVVDPQGEFAKDMRKQYSGSFKLPMRDVLRKQVEVYGVRDLILDRWDLFENILRLSGFPSRFAIKHPNNQRQAAEVIREMLERDVKLADLHKSETLDKVMNGLGQDRYLNRIYSDNQKRKDVLLQIGEIDRGDLYKSVWSPATQLFRTDRPGSLKVESLLSRLFNPEQDQRPLVVIDLSAEQARVKPTSNTSQLALPDGHDERDSGGNEHGTLFWNETIQALVIKRLLEGVQLAADRAYKENRGLNTLLLIDEAHRLAPRDTPGDDEEKAVRALLIDAARTTRKQGVGWMFISQTLSSLHKEIVGQMRILFFGFGLSMGAEYQALRELVAGQGKALELYQRFRDPHSSFDTSSREYSFMTIGPVSPLSFYNSPLFFNVFNNVDSFLEANGLPRASVSRDTQQLAQRVAPLPTRRPVRRLPL